MNNKQIETLSQALINQLEISGSLLDTLEQVCQLVEQTQNLALRESVVNLITPVIVRSVKNQKTVAEFLLKLTDYPNRNQKPTGV